MTDDDMDARLRTAGAAWRTTTDDAHPVSPEPLSPAETLQLGRPARERRHRTAWLASAAAVAAVLVAGGGFLVGRLADGDGDHGHRTTAAERAALQNTVWELLGYDGDQLRPSSFSTFYVHDGAFVADDSCGLYNGGVKVEGAHLHVSDVEDRFYNCTDSVGEITFREGMKTLQTDPAFRVDGDHLTISGDGPTLHLKAAPELPAPTSDRPTLTGATWRLMKVEGANGAQHVVDGTAEFRIDGNHLHATDTCNSLDSTLQVDYPILKLDAVATTEIGCPPDSVAPIVDQILSGNVRADFRDAALTLTKTGAGTLTYRWQPDDEAAVDPKLLTATDWQLRSIAGVPTGGMTLSVADGRLELRAACATTNVPVEIGPGTVIAPNLAKEPKNECPSERDDVTQMLASGPALWHISGKQLVINRAGSQGFSLVFDPVKDVSAASVELPGTWKLIGVEKTDGNTVSGSGSSDSTITLTLTASTYRVSTPCPPWNGTVVFGDRTVVFTLMSIAAGPSCSTAAGELTSQVAKVVAGTATWTIENGQLKLTKGTVTLTFER